jgi:hypothetical protein
MSSPKYLFIVKQSWAKLESEQDAASGRLREVHDDLFTWQRYSAFHTPNMGFALLPLAIPRLHPQHERFTDPPSEGRVNEAQRRDLRLYPQQERRQNRRRGGASMKLKEQIDRTMT